MFALWQNLKHICCQTSRTTTRTWSALPWRAWAKTAPEFSQNSLVLEYGIEISLKHRQSSRLLAKNLPVRMWRPCQQELWVGLGGRQKEITDTRKLGLKDLSYVTSEPTSATFLITTAHCRHLQLRRIRPGWDSGPLWRTCPHATRDEGPDPLDR